MMQKPPPDKAAEATAPLGSRRSTLAVLAEMLAAGLNPSVAGGDHAATYIENPASKDCGTRSLGTSR